jgi:hypothetical protein
MGIPSLSTVLGILPCEKSPFFGFLCCANGITAFLNVLLFIITQITKGGDDGPNLYKPQDIAYNEKVIALFLWTIEQSGERI